MLALEITSRPIEWEFKITPAQLKMRQSDNPSMTMDRVPPTLSVNHTKNIEVRLDSTELRPACSAETDGAARYIYIFPAIGPL